MCTSLLQVVNGQIQILNPHKLYNYWIRRK